MRNQNIDDDMDSRECPLCGSIWQLLGGLKLVSQDGRLFYVCGTCALIYCDPSVHLSREVEKLRYDEHNNDANDPAYLAFLAQVIDPVKDRLQPGMVALDYGSGPGPAMPEVLRPHGVRCELYDPIYAPVLPDLPYDVITSTETFEHFQDVAASMREVTDLLKDGGLLCIKTEQWTDLSRFSGWQYTRDDTHVCFYHARTFDWIAARYGYRMLFNDGKRVVCLQKIA